MSAYLIVDVAGIRDPEMYDAYRAQVSPQIECAGGRYLARGGPIQVLEGDWHPSRIVLVRFDSTSAAKHWWSSPEYAPLREMRQRSTKTCMIVVDGLADDGGQS